MSKIFLATSFSGKTDEQGRILRQYRLFVEDILTSLRTKFEVFCAAEYEGWQYYHATAEAGVEKDLEEIDKADMLVALIHPNVSAGLNVEIGYAVAKGKKVFLVTEPDVGLNYFNRGLVNLGKAAHFQYQNSEVLTRDVESSQ